MFWSIASSLRLGGQRWAIALTVLSVAAVLAACGSGDDRKPPAGLEHDVHVHLDEWSVKVDPPSVSGPATINIGGHNHGKYPHQITVVKTDLDPAALPISQSRVDIQAIGKPAAAFDVPAADGGEGLQVVSADLTPGKYVIFCAIPGHYQQGMHTGFEVIAAP